MDKLNSIQIPINIFENFVDDIIITLINSFFHLVLLGLIILFAENNNFTLCVICVILFCLAFIVTPGITYFYSNAFLQVSEVGFRIKKYNDEILFVSFDNLIAINAKKYEMKSNTFFDISINYKEFQIVDFCTDKTLNFKIVKKNFKNANQYYDSIVDFFRLNSNLPQVWHSNFISS